MFRKNFVRGLVNISSDSLGQRFSFKTSFKPFQLKTNFQWSQQQQQQQQQQQEHWQNGLTQILRLDHFEKMLTLLNLKFYASSDSSVVDQLTHYLKFEVQIHSLLEKV
jgi:hypothetical protein